MTVIIYFGVFLVIGSVAAFWIRIRFHEHGVGFFHSCFVIYATMFASICIVELSCLVGLEEKYCNNVCIVEESISFDVDGTVNTISLEDVEIHFIEEESMYLHYKEADNVLYNRVGSKILTTDIRYHDVILYMPKQS